MPNEPLISSNSIQRAFVLGGIGAVSLIIGILLLMSSRPQGQLVAVDESQHQARLVAAESALRGYELVGEGARIDIQHAMMLVVERGVDQPIRAGGVPPIAVNATAEAPTDGPDGAALYAMHCAACHQATGLGVAMAFPPLVDHIGALVAAERLYAPKTVLYGLMGAIEVKGTTYMGVMPGLGMLLSDAEVAAILNHAVLSFDAFDDFEPFVAEEIAELRATPLQMTDVHAIRVEMDLP